MHCYRIILKQFYRFEHKNFKNVKSFCRRELRFKEHSKFSCGGKKTLLNHSLKGQFANKSSPTYLNNSANDFDFRFNCKT